MYSFLFSISLFLSAFLLFIIQPLVAKILLPFYGGTPAVWTVCMLFFQLLLLVAYAYAWILSQFKASYHWRLIHFIICFFSLSALPLNYLPVSGLGAPEWLILKDLFLQLGLPLLVVGSSAPLLQYAYSQTSGRQAADPYFLYVASNVGSLIALLSYPWFVERYWGVEQQLHLWNVVYLVYLAMLFYLLFSVHFKSKIHAEVENIKIAYSRYAIWIFLSFVPCSLMMGVTFYISTDIAATPLFWVVPLALYLLSFVVTFARHPVISHAWVVRNVLLVMVFPMLGFICDTYQNTLIFLIFIHLFCFFMFALLCHGELINLRPKTQKLTAFYFCLALGGVLAGIFNGILAPRLFVSAFEYPLVLLLSILCIPIKPKKQYWVIPLIIALLLLSHLLPDNNWRHVLRVNHVAEIVSLGLIMVWPGSRFNLFFGMSLIFLFVLMPWFKPVQILNQSRNFYGIKQVFSQHGTHALMSQSTLHGFQVELDEKQTNGAIAYYGPVYPVVQQLQIKHQSLHATVLGLGAGTLACQFRVQDKLTFIEIDQQVIDIASNSHLFNYLQDCSPNKILIQNDGRIAVSKFPDASYQLLVMDAFSSDAIPTHLLTLEAFELYKKKMSFDGVIMVNLSNRHLNALPVVTAAGRELDMIVLHKTHPGSIKMRQFSSEWALLTSNESLAAYLMRHENWHFVADSKIVLWTNDYSNLVPLLKW